MALCLAESLMECKAFDPADPMGHYVHCWRDGYLSSTGCSFDIGDTLSAALRRFEVSGKPCSGGSDLRSAGKGPIMGLASVPMFYVRYPRAPFRWPVRGGWGDKWFR